MGKADIFRQWVSKRLFEDMTLNHEDSEVSFNYLEREFEAEGPAITKALR